MGEGNINPTDVQKGLKGADFPASKEQLIELAGRNKARQDVLEFLERIPERSYQSPVQVTEQIGRDDGRIDDMTGMPMP